MSHRTLLAFAVALAIPAFLLAAGPFQPFEERVTLGGEIASHSFSLESPQPLYLEFEFAVQPPPGLDTDVDAAAIAISLNDVLVARLSTERYFVMARAMPLVSRSLVLSGENRLDVEVDGPTGFTFDMNLRVHNYSGINPQFPRAFIVPDEAVFRDLLGRPPWTHLSRLALILAASVLVVLTLARALQGHSRRTSMLVMFSPLILLWGGLAYSLVVPEHVWLSFGGLIVVTLVPVLGSAAILWIGAHRQATITAIAVTAVTLIVGEVGLRILNLARPLPVFFSDSYSRFRGQPGGEFLGTRLNSMGFNDVEHAEARPAHVRYRIAALGDSMTFGVVPYQANFVTVLEGELSDDGTVEVINFGVPGTTPRDYLSMLTTESLPFEPDLVMVGLFVGNDFESPRQALFERSYLATSLYFLSRVGRSVAPGETVFTVTDGTYIDDAPTYARERFLEIEVDRAWVYDPSGAIAEAVPAVVGTLQDMRDLSARAGADFLVVIMPDEAQVNDALATVVRQAYGSGASALDFSWPNQLLGDALARANIAYLDLLPKYREMGPQARLYKPQDTHWNIAGNRLAAATIAQHFERDVQRAR